MTDTPATPLIELSQLVKSYGVEPSAVEVLHGIDLSLVEGEYLAIVGPSGSGKSTLMNILGCLDRPTSGRYLIAGRDAANMSDRELSRLRNDSIGFVFQSFQLVAHLTVLENVELPLFYARVARRERRKRAAELLEKVGLGHRLDHIPSQLSGGERQRVAVARALSNDPELILADEPTGNLDSKTSASILELLSDLHEAGRTIIMITHDPAIAAAAPREVRLLDGRIEADLRREAVGA